MSLWGALSGMLWGGVVRMFVVEQTMSAINSIMHTFGAQPFVTRDDNSRNLGVTAGSPGARAGTTTTMPSRIPPPSACAGSSSIPASSLSARWKRWDSPGTSRYRVRRRSRGACCDSRAMRRPTWKRAEHHRPAREPTIGTTIRAAPWLSIWLERRSVEGWGVCCFPASVLLLNSCTDCRNFPRPTAVLDSLVARRDAVIRSYGAVGS
ncbi:hypothetical protein ACVWXO_005165 [Bradyrhizobium sp. LM2.7]